MRDGRAVLGALVLAGGLALVGCGVEVPDDVAAATSTTVDEPVTTTEPPMSDDDLEQTLIDNGYSLDEARCGAENLRAELDDGQIEEVVGADDIGEIRDSTATAIRDALQPCID